MGKVLGWIVVIGLIYFGYQAGWFTSIINYFTDSYDKARQEQVIENPDGSVTTVKYRNIFDMLAGK